MAWLPAAIRDTVFSQVPVPTPKKSLSLGEDQGAGGQTPTEKIPDRFRHKGAIWNVQSKFFFDYELKPAFL